MHWIFEYKDVQIRLFRIHLGLIHQVSRMAMLIKPLTALPKSAEFETIKLRGYFMKPIKIRNPPTIFHYSVFSSKAGESRPTKKEPRYWKAGKEKVKAFLASVSYRKLGMMYYTIGLLLHNGQRDFDAS